MTEFLGEFLGTMVLILLGDGVVAGVPYARLDPAAGLDDVLLMAATETTTSDHIAALAAGLSKASR